MKMINKASDFIKSKISISPKIGIILGTGLNNLANLVQNPQVLLYKEIPGFVESTAPSHSGQLIFGQIGKTDVVLMQGRFHFYEGYSMDEVTFPVRIFAKLGVEYMFVTNASGSLQEEMGPGSLVLLYDHINFMGTNPLIGKNKSEFGERFPSMHEPFDYKLRNIVKQISQDNSIKIFDGVYVSVTGPSIETKAECKMLQTMGADVVGMSTVPEVIVAVHSGLKCLGISCVTNHSNLFHNKAHSQEEIRENAEKARLDLEKIVIETIKKISERS
ncbi:MAG: purine-nucleoside phosphorylase [Candidatus Cloacimonadota bacterium]|nr:purine-nucleoside phosphorylase [Candidatus Cloacimonadota bacterium]